MQATFSLYFFTQQAPDYSPPQHIEVAPSS